MTSLAMRPSDREVETAVDDFKLTGRFNWDPTAGDFSLDECYLHQKNLCMTVDNPSTLGALRGGKWMSFEQMLWEAW